MNKIALYKKEIIISIITGFLMIFIQKAIDNIGNFFLNQYIKLSTSFSDSYYKAMAFNNDREFDDNTNFIIYYITFLFVVVLSLSLFFLRRLTKKNEILENEKSSKTYPRIRTFRRKFVDSRFSMYLIYVLVTLIGLALFGGYTTTRMINLKNVEFRNDIYKISPYVNDSIVLKFRSDWAQMENSGDYNNLKNVIEKIKQKHKIK